MIHYGDITKIKGAEVPLVDVVTGGSPCQDLSIAGKRQGLAGERSGLFMEQIRVIKELRDESRKKLGTDDPRRIVPRFMVWENVPGAFSSNNGEDFRAVLEETARIADKAATIPRPAEKKGKLQWSTSGCIMGDGWSIAWRVHDAQFWGVPQRRKRIALVADFGGFTAPEILFERKGMSGDIETCGEKGEGVAGDVENGIGETSAVGVLNDQGGSVMNVSENVTGALRAQEHGHQPIVFEPGAASRVGGHVYEDGIAGTVRANAGDNQQAIVYGISSYNSNAMKSDNPNSGIYKAETARTIDLNGGNPACNQGGMAVVQGLDAYNQTITGDVAMPIRSKAADAEHIPCVCVGNGQLAQAKLSEKVGALNCMHDQQAIMSGGEVRRLTPTECERLQNYPDGWTDIGEWVDSKGKKHKAADSPRYKALGNSIALPFWQWMAERMVRIIKNDEPEKEPTMASLFDGIGGFPLVYSRCGCKPVWGSEVEEFAIAVTKRRFPEESEEE